MANIFMTIYGKVGWFAELAKQNLAKAAYAAQQFGKHAVLRFPGRAPVQRVECRPARIPTRARRLLKRGGLGFGCGQRRTPKSFYVDLMLKRACLVIKYNIIQCLELIKSLY